MIGMSAAELNMISGDFIDLINGADSNTVVMTWETGTPNPVYQGKWVGSPTLNTQTFNAIVVYAAAYRAETGYMRNGLVKRKFAELPDADIALIMPASVNLQGMVNVIFQISGMGNYHPLEKPAEDVTQYAVMSPSGQAMVQYVFAKAVK